MRYAYVTRRSAPQGYVAVTRLLAKLLYNSGKAVTLCGSNVNSCHVFDGWHLGCTVQVDSHDNNGFSVLVGNFLYYLDKELGAYPVFYVKQKDTAMINSPLRQW